MNHVILTGRTPRQKIRAINEPVDEDHGWKQYKNTNYWFNQDGRCVNKKTKKYLNACLNPDGYLRYYLYINQKRITILAHRAVYETFSDNELTSIDQVNHIDGNKQNNNYTNLEKVSRQENMLHSYYVLKKNIKPIIQYDLNYNIIQEYPSISEAARVLNISTSGIVQACKGQIKTYYNYIWKYKKV